MSENVRKCPGSTAASWNLGWMSKIRRKDVTFRTFSDIFGHFRTFSDVVRVPRLQVGLGLDIQNLAKRCNFSDTFRTLFGHFSDTFRTLFGHFSDIPGSKARRHPKLGLEHLEHTEYATSEIRWAKRCNFSDQILSKSQKPPKVED